MRSIYFKCLLTPVFCLLAVCAWAQSDQINFGIGPELGIPFNTGSTKSGNIYNTGLGIDAKLEFPVIAGLKVTVAGGYLNYDAKGTYYLINPGGGSYSYNPGPFRFLPLKAGLRYYLVKGFYIGGDAGEAIKLNNNVYSSFIYSGGLGYNFLIGAFDSVDFGVRYENGYKSVIFDYPMNEVAVSVAFKF